MTLNNCYYMDPLFDLYLGNYSIDKVDRSAPEMGVLFYALCKDNDTLILDIEVPQDYSTYLESKGLSKPRIVRSGNPAELSLTNGVAWGWSENSKRILTKYNAVCDMPDYEIIKKVNDRKFCNEIGRKYGLGVNGSFFCGCVKDYRIALEKHENNYPLALKAAFGASGSGIKVIENPEKCADFEEYAHYFCEHGGFVLEPWCERHYDLSTNLCISKNGEILSMNHQRLFSNSHGSFFGIYCAPDDEKLDKWRKNLEESAKAAALEMAQAGYYGVAGFDSFVYSDSKGQEQLAAVIEINGRFVMSHIAQELRKRLAPDKYCFMRMIGRKHCKMPQDYDSWNKILHGLDGVILLTPLRVRHDLQWVQPRRSAVFLYAETEKDLFNLDYLVRSGISGKSVVQQ